MSLIYIVSFLSNKIGFRFSSCSLTFSLKFKVECEFRVGTWKRKWTINLSRRDAWSRIFVLLRRKKKKKFSLFLAVSSYTQGALVSFMSFEPFEAPAVIPILASLLSPHSRIFTTFINSKKHVLLFKWILPACLISFYFNSIICKK